MYGSFLILLTDPSNMKKPNSFLQYLIRFFKSLSKKDSQKEDDIAAEEQIQFSLQTLIAATRDFHSDHKLGEGGFGPVYKGKLRDGREIAVKKLSQRSNQGKREFMNEATLLATVQHRNVVNLLGYCAQGEEKLLVYEYVSNESLDKILFRKTAELDWKKRYEVIAGVARGLLYLHEDSHSVIIHRDIKASNILLDDKWCPKIADFGMARLFPESATKTHVNTRIAGTNGYMAPEYAMHGQLSVKADVFSYGVVVLELISGQKNYTFNLDPACQNLLEWVWKLYKKGRSLEIMDPALASSAITEQVAKCIQIGLLCTQADPKLRPTMRRVVVMLSKRAGTLDEPTRPGYPRSRNGRTPRTHAAGSSSAGGSSRSSSSQSFPTTTTTNTATTSTLTSPRPHSYGKRPMQG
ncbi:putative receptor-like protein kinase At4g00960 [Telopea speciosissima]|uniref:putative receptor-like protein kinase At4g00960 n=1 Tax=Telopea speciosissima TaxID=54955 RepID=UPI001CC595CA|nr:putative receptor-like protein kinase At4g00960 [Telopea speciosissima]